MHVASVIVMLPSCRYPSHHKIPQTILSNRQAGQTVSHMAQEAALILSFYKSPCQLLLTLWAGTRDLAVSCPQRDYCIYSILPPGHRHSAIPQFS